MITRKTFFLFVCLLFTTSVVFARQVMVQRLRGNVDMFSKGKWTAAKIGTVLSVHDKVRTKSRISYCILLFEDGHTMRLGGNTAIAISEIITDASQVSLEKGRIRVRIKQFFGGRSFRIKTPTAVCSVRGTDFAVEFADNITRLEVYEGVVSAKEETTGKEIMVNPGEFSVIEQGGEPSVPEPLQEKPPAEESEETSVPDPEEKSKEELKAEAEREIFQDISREAVMERAAEEIKLAEFQNGKAIIDVFGKRVRMEEYIVRPKPEQFKYVVLNNREDRFDFGKILFTFNKELPTNLTLATKEMFYKEGPSRPEWELANVESVMSNTLDKVLEDASGGTMVPNDSTNPSYWTHFFTSYKFYIGNINSTENNGKGVIKWQYEDKNYDFKAQTDEFTYLPGTAFESHNDPALKEGQTQLDGNLFSPQPQGTDIYYFRSRDEYADATFVQADDYIITDEGKIATKETLKTTADLYGLNFERVFTATEFAGRKIDLIFSSKLLIDAGILRIPEIQTATASSMLRVN
ncbi:MAG: FecR family protein [Elusimicrobiota bacterium]